MLRRFLSISLMLGILVSMASAQIAAPRPVPRPRPSAGPRPVRNNPSPHAKPRPRSMRDIERRRDGSKKPKSGSTTPGTPPAGGGGKDAGKPGPVPGPGRAAIKAGARRLKIRGALMRGARTETWVGEATVSLGSAGKFKSKVKIELRRSRDGSIAQRFTYQRRGDLPDATRLLRRNAKGGQEWWLFRPEERRVSKATSSAALAESALRFQDMVDMDLIALRAKFLGKKTLSKKTVFVYSVNALATADEPKVKVYVRTDNNLISRLEYLDAKGLVRRQVLFREPRSFGVQKRWTKIVVHDVVAGRSATIVFKEIKINTEISALRFLPDHLGD